MSEITKKCIKCLKEKPATLEFFIKRKNANQDVLRNTCRDCLTELEHQRVKNRIENNCFKTSENKVCPRCEIEKPLTIDFFQKNKTSATGFASRCKVCCRELDNMRYHGIVEVKKEKIIIVPKTKICSTCKKELPLNDKNYGEWHIDHLRPLSSFEFESYDEENFKKAWSLSNLQPLWAKDNLTKSGKWNPKQLLKGGSIQTTLIL